MADRLLDLELSQRSEGVAPDDIFIFALAYFFFRSLPLINGFQQGKVPVFAFCYGVFQMPDGFFFRRRRVIRVYVHIYFNNLFSNFLFL